MEWFTTRLRALRHRLALRGPPAGPSGTPTYPTCVHAGLSLRVPGLAGIPGRDRRTRGAVSRSAVGARKTRRPARSRVIWHCPAVCLRSNSGRGHGANRRAGIRMQEVIAQLSWDGLASGRSATRDYISVSRMDLSSQGGIYAPVRRRLGNEVEFGRRNVVWVEDLTTASPRPSSSARTTSMGGGYRSPHR